MSLADAIVLLQLMLPNLVTQTIKDIQGGLDKDNGNDDSEEKRTVYRDNNMLPMYPSDSPSFEVMASPGG